MAILSSALWPPAVFGLEQVNAPPQALFPKVHVFDAGGRTLMPGL